MTAAWTAGYEAGRAEGWNEGHASGVNIGREQGFKAVMNCDASLAELHAVKYTLAVVEQHLRTNRKSADKTVRDLNMSRVAAILLREKISLLRKKISEAARTLAAILDKRDLTGEHMDVVREIIRQVLIELRS